MVYNVSVLSSTSFFSLSLPSLSSHHHRTCSPLKVFFYNYGWIDYGVPSMGSLLNMVKVVAFALQSGKVAIHCHAGLGRTGVLIACYLVFGLRLGWEEAILKVRTKRWVCLIHAKLMYVCHFCCMGRMYVCVPCVVWLCGCLVYLTCPL